MKKSSVSIILAALLAVSGAVSAQPRGITMDMINTTLPLEGAPKAIAGPYEVIKDTASGTTGLILFRPAQLAAFPRKDKLPLMVWGNGGCSIDGNSYSDFLTTIASHGFLTMTTVPVEGEQRRQENMDDINKAIAWAKAENERSGSPLQGKIDMAHIAVMGQSCGGFLSIGMGTDPRIGTIGVFNSGVQPASGDGAAGGGFPTTDALAKLHGPVLFKK